MTNPRYVPDFKLTIDGSAVPAVMRASTTSVSLQTGLEGADRVEVTLFNERLRWLDDALLRPGRELAVSMGYQPDAIERVFTGDIIGQSASFPSDGAPTLTVTAQDREQRLHEGTKMRWFNIPIPSVGQLPQPDLMIASSVAGEAGLQAAVDPVGASIATVLGGVEAVATGGDPQAIQRLIRKQENESNFAFLERIARENGWEMFVDHAAGGGARLRFMSPLDQLSPTATLVYGQSLLSFSPRLSTSGQTASVTAYVWVAFTKKQYKVTVSADWDSASLNIDIGEGAAEPQQSPAEFVLDEPATPATAARRILSEFLPKLNRRLTASVSTPGDTRLRAGVVVQIEGVGERFGGLYRVTSATHTIDGGGYRTDADLRKELWFGSIPAMAQGAVRIRAG